MLMFLECLESLQGFGERVLPQMHTVKPAPTAAPPGASLDVELS